MNNLIKLNAENLAILADAIEIPRHNRGEVRAGIAHIGIGGFHRAHQAYLVNKLLEMGLGKDWGICGIALLEADKKIYNVLLEQDGLYTLMVPDHVGNISAQVIGSIVEILYAPDNQFAVIQKLADPTIKIITLTITEGGYNLTSDGGFNWDNEAVLWDLKHPNQPKTVFGYLYSALKRREILDAGRLTIQSCDNMEHNGDVARRMLYAFIEKADPQMIGWLNENVTFPNSMVDRITPATTEQLKMTLASDFGVLDGWPVVCEPFCQWLIQDAYAAGRPEWERVGGQLVSDVTPYEKMKIRLLNGGHTLVGLLGYLSGYQYIHESTADPLIAGLLRKYMDEEVTPTLDEVPGIDLIEYKNTLIERFGNPFIKDEVTRIISGSSAKFPKFILPVISDQLEAQRSVRIAALIAACWYQYLKLNLSAPDDIQDEMRILLLKSIAQGEQEQNTLLFLDNAQVFADLKEHQTFAEIFSAHIVALNNIGMRSLVEAELSRD